MSPLKTIASAITIGTGGAAGREGPTALIAAGIGSMYATFRKRTDEERKLLVLIGMAAGLSAIFRSPIGAAIFAIEVLYDDMEFETSSLLYTILASVVAYTVNGLFDSWEPLFLVPADLAVSHANDYFEYAILGLAGGLVAVALPMVFYGARDMFHSIPVPPHVKPAIGGLLVGLMALVVPEVLGRLWLDQDAMDGKMALSLMIVLVFGKIIAMSLTVGSGGSGGVFAPSLFVGAMLGGVMADVFDHESRRRSWWSVWPPCSAARAAYRWRRCSSSPRYRGYHLLAPAALVVTISYMIQQHSVQAEISQPVRSCRFTGPVGARHRPAGKRARGRDAMTTEFDLGA